MLAGCWRGATSPPSPPAPSCTAVAIHLARLGAAIALAEQDTDDPELREAVELAAEGTIIKTRRECLESDWSPDHRGCLGRTASEHDIVMCERARLIADGADMGGPDCSRVVDHWFAKIGALAATTTEHGAKLRTRLADGCLAMTRQQKECALATDALDTFVNCGKPARARRRPRP